MYTSFRVKNFRCFEDLELNDLARVNLIAGKNNVGKTALLEALYLHARAYNPQYIFDLDAVRGLKPNFEQPIQELELIFHNRDFSHTVTLEATDTESGRRTLGLRWVQDMKELPEQEQRLPVAKDRINDGLSMSSVSPAILALDYENGGRQGTIFLRDGGELRPVPPPAPFPVSFIPSQGRPPLKEIAKAFTGLVASGKRHILMEVLKKVDIRIRGIELLNFNDDSILHGDVGHGGPIPFLYLGEGINRLTNFVLSIANSQNGMVIIDEIENGLHYTSLIDVWKAIADTACQFNTQIFATTHSREMILAAHQAFSERETYDFRLHRLDRNKKTGKIEAKTYDQEILEAAVDANFEVR